MKEQVANWDKALRRLKNKTRYKWVRMKRCLVIKLMFNLFICNVSDYFFKNN